MALPLWLLVPCAASVLLDATRRRRAYLRVHTPAGLHTIHCVSRRDDLALDRFMAVGGEDGS